MTTPQRHQQTLDPLYAHETQITHGPGGRILTNVNVWSPDSRRIVYDTRSDTNGTRFDGSRIEVVDVETGAIRTVYTSRNGAFCGVATFHPTLDRVVFILGPEHPTPDWQYGPSHRQGVLVDLARPNVAVNLEARDLMPPFTPGALRGGTHVHAYSPDGAWVGFTYNDAALSGLSDQRNVGVSGPFGAVTVPAGDRNHSSVAFSVLVTQTTARPTPGSDEIQRAFEEGWVGDSGYLRPDGTRQNRALAFLGEVIAPDGAPIIEVFIVDLPDDLTVPGDLGPLEGTATLRPAPPRGTIQRRLTFTADRPFPGVEGPRHWVRSSPDGTQIAFLMRDDAGLPQIWTILPAGGAPRQMTRDTWGVASAFTWSPDSRNIAYIADNSVFVVAADSGESRRLTPRSPDADAPLPLACVFSPKGQRIAFLRRLAETEESESGESDAPRSNQVCVVTLAPTLTPLPPLPQAGRGGV